MWEELHIAAGMRLPIVMANANRALSAPINIHCDHSRRHGRARHRLDHPVRRDGAGGLRQHDHGRAHRRASRRAAAGDEHASTASSPRTRSTARRSWTTRRSRRSSASTRPRTRCSTSTTRSRTATSPASAVRTSSSRSRSATPSTARPPSSRRSATSGRSSAAGRSASSRAGAWKTPRSPIVVIGSTAGNARHVARELRAQGATRRRAQGALLPPVPVRGDRRRARGLQGRRRARPRRVLRRRGRPALPRGHAARCTTSRRASRSSTTSTASAAAT